MRLKKDQSPLNFYLNHLLAMVNSRVYIPPVQQVRFWFQVACKANSTIKAFETKLRCRLYSTTASKLRQVVVTARCTDRCVKASRYPFVESLLQDAVLQPYIHDCIIQVWEGRHLYRFRIFFKRHCHLPINRSLPELSLRGDSVIMRVSRRNSLSVVNMRGRDSILSDYAIKK